MAAPRTNPVESSFGHALNACPRKGCADGSVTADQDDLVLHPSYAPRPLVSRQMPLDINVQHAIEVFEAVAADGSPNQDSGIRRRKHAASAETLLRLDQLLHECHRQRRYSL